MTANAVSLISIFRFIPANGSHSVPSTVLMQWNCDQPFCMMIGYISPHHPFDPPAPYSTMYDPNSLHLLPGYTGSAAPLRF